MSTAKNAKDNSSEGAHFEDTTFAFHFAIASPPWFYLVIREIDTLFCHFL